jgi:NAD(P)H-dependent FMN reductase
MSKNIAVIIGSTRASRISVKLTDWVISKLPTEGATYEVVDLAEWNLPMFDELLSPAKGQYTGEHTKKWSAKIKEFDGFIVVSPEYNAGYPAALKNAIDYLYAEWADKPVVVVTYGYGGGASSNNQIKEVLLRLKMRVTPTSPMLPFSDGIFSEDGQLKDAEAAFGTQSSEITKAGEELLSI